MKESNISFAGDSDDGELAMEDDIVEDMVESNRSMLDFFKPMKDKCVRCGIEFDDDADEHFRVAVAASSNEIGHGGGDKYEVCNLCVENDRVIREKRANRKRTRMDTVISNARNQTDILRFSEKTKYECLVCDAPNLDQEICEECTRSGRGQELVDTIRKRLLADQVDQCRICENSCNVGASIEIEEDTDIENLVTGYYETHPLADNCVNFNCENRWDRARAIQQLKMINHIDEKVIKSGKRTKITIEYAEDD